MAKKTKAANLSIEEKLEQALIVPGYEPYKIPDNWCWTNLKTVCNLDNGIKHNNESLVYFDAKTLREITEPVSRNSGVIVEKGQKVILVDGENSGEVFVIPDRGYMGSTFRILNISKQFDEMYIRYFIDIFREELKKNKIGSAIPHLNKELFYGLQFPLPPLPEQQRIVERIESLFSKLDEAKEKAQEVIDSFETRKAAILHKAFSGELTAKWREENGVGIESWEEKPIKEVSIPRAGYAFDSKEFTDSGYQVIRMGNLYNGVLDLYRNPVFVSVENVDDSILNRSLVHSGDILITLTGTKYKRDYGYAVRIDEPYDLLVNQRILCLSPDINSIDSDYFLYYLQSNRFRDVFFSNETGGVNQGNVSSKFVESIQIPVPTYQEQKQLGESISKMISYLVYSKELAESVIDQIDAMKKAILARAFRGELGTNDPKEESAVELLKQILSGE